MSVLIGKFFLFFCFFNASGVLFAASSPDPIKLTLPKTIELAVRNSPEVLSAEQEVKLTRQRVRDAKFQFAPQISFSGTAARFNAEESLVSGPELGNRFFLPSLFEEDVFTARLQVLQPLYEGGRNVNNLRLAKVAHNRAKVNYEALKSSKSFSAKLAYFKLQ